ncbi:hypothetical protein ABZP36_025400 [Zizania latifolia]
MWWRGDDVFSRSRSSSRAEEDDEEALRWAALEKLPTYDRVRRAILPLDDGGEGGGEAGKRVVDVLSLGPQERRALLERLVRVAEDDNERFLLKLKERIERVGIDIPTIEVRFEHLNAEAEVRVGNSGLPTVLNSITNKLEEAANALGILSSRKHIMPILHDVSGIIKPRRMTLLLGPPGSGKTTLLLALAGRLDKDLKVLQAVSASVSTQPNGSVSLPIPWWGSKEHDRCKCLWIVHVANLYGPWWFYPSKRRNKALIQELSTPPPGSSELYFPTQYSQSFLNQCLACLWKQHLSYWRNPSYNAIRIFFTTVIALLFGTIFWDLGGKMGQSQDLFNAMGSMYSAVLFIGVLNSTSVQPVVSVERTVFYRERAAGMYSALPYAFGQVAIEFPYTLAQSAIYGIIVYSMIGFQWTVAKFFWYLFFMYFTLLYFTFYGMMAVGLTPSYHVASIVSSAFYGIWNLFSGFIIPRPKVPIWWRWYCWICPVAWTLYGLVVSQFGDIMTPMDDGTPVKVFVENYFDFKHSWLWVVAVVIVAFTFFFAFLFGFAIMKFNFQKR